MFHFMSKQAQVEIPLEARKASLLGSGRTYDYWVKLIEKYRKYIFIFQQTGSQVNLQRVVTVYKKATQRRVYSVVARLWTEIFNVTIHSY